ncbi:MAG: hypothetical protein HYZ42_17550 [Bacteroidetes bacterium]|nr:hypothetical protein [Bacteroidota bacterium]
MKTIYILLFLLCLTSFFTADLSAQQKHSNHQKGHQGNRGGTMKQGHVKQKKTVVINSNRYPRNRAVIVKKRTYWSAPRMNAGHTKLIYNGRNYFYQNGRYYHYRNNNYIVIAPPSGIRLSILPIGYHRLLLGSSVYYYYFGTYYREVDHQYITIRPMIGSIVPELPEYNVDEITIDGVTYYEYDHMLYKPIVTSTGVQYEVISEFN